MNEPVNVSPGDGRAGRPTQPRAVRLAAIGLWVRAALRLPVLFFVWFYVSRGIDMGRSPDFPDGASFVWFFYTMSEADNFLMVPVGLLVDAGIGWTRMESWLVGYSVVTVCYVIVGLLVLRGSRFVRRVYRAGLVYMVLSFCVHVLTLIVVVPGAVDAVRTGENAPVYPYTGATLVHAYEWLLLPWALALPAVTVAVVLLLRTSTARAYLSVAVSPTSGALAVRRAQRDHSGTPSAHA